MTDDSLVPGRDCTECDWQAWRADVTECPECGADVRAVQKASVDAETTSAELGRSLNDISEDEERLLQFMLRRARHRIR